MAFFNEFPHTRTFDSDLAWLIKRMKEVLARMDSVEARMKALEDLVENFIATLNIDQIIADQLRQMVADGTFEAILQELVEPLEKYKNGFSQFYTVQNLKILASDGTTELTLASSGNPQISEYRAGVFYLNIILYPYNKDALTVGFDPVAAINAICGRAGGYNPLNDGWTVFNATRPSENYWYHTIPLAVNDDNIPIRFSQIGGVSRIYMDASQYPSVISTSQQISAFIPIKLTKLFS